MGSNLLTDNPFAILTFIAAPAILTNATSLLALSTSNRLLRTRESMRDLCKESEKATHPQSADFLAHVSRIERQATMLLRALHFIYVGLGAFVMATLVTLLGSVAGQMGSEIGMRIVIGMGLILGIVGVTGLVGGCVNLFHATQLSLIGIREEATAIRARQERLKQSPD